MIFDLLNADVIKRGKDDFFTNDGDAVNSNWAF
uniref:Uncharacterized protein n=1 Tax=Rhizophora mucronata TaxID=61149 RepID=A0A2P2KS63_RHIMU